MSNSQDIIDNAKNILPRDVFLKIVGILCCDMDMRIRFGLVRKLKITNELGERLRALVKPQKGMDSFTTVVQLGYNASITNIHKHKIIMYYKDLQSLNGTQNFGVLVHSKEVDTDQHLITWFGCEEDSCQYEELSTWYI